ncbi:hypothetical protein GobsT_04490 [Gemmata obscuriglobus]|nr:hypothetical protein GobsT_04490 [Gemmata obscuriglobus]VTR99444.1 unnamed protein product [Gemmata obscuriglobus UQM 2246]
MGVRVSASARILSCPQQRACGLDPLDQNYRVVWFGNAAVKSVRP